MTSINHTNRMWLSHILLSSIKWQKQVKTNYKKVTTTMTQTGNNQSQSSS